MEFYSFAEIITAVAMVLGGQKGLEFYKKKKYLNGGRDRRSSSGNNPGQSSLSQPDKDFIEACFKTQTKEAAMEAKTNRLELVVELGTIIRNEGASTRETVRSVR